MKKLLLIMAVGLLSTQVSANTVDNSSARYSPIEITLVSETNIAYGLKICNYEKTKFGYPLAHFSKVVRQGLTCPVIGPQ